MRTLYEYILDELAYSNIFEQAFQRKQLANKIFDRIPQILQNWGLVIYGSQNDLETTNHWKSELIAQCDYIIDAELKGSDKKRLIKQEIIDHGEFDSPNKVLRKIKRKFEEENIDGETIASLANYMSTNIDKLIDILASDSCDEWVENNCEIL